MYNLSTTFPIRAIRVGLKGVTIPAFAGMANNLSPRHSRESGNPEKSKYMAGFIIFTENC